MDRGEPSASHAVHGSERRQESERRRQRAVGDEYPRWSARRAHLQTPPSALRSTSWSARRVNRRRTVATPSLGRERLEALTTLDDAAIEVMKRVVSGDLPPGTRQLL